MRRLLLVALLGVLTEASYGQQYPLFTQYVYDPYFINPSMVGFSGQSEINLSVRQQWTGFQNNPQTIQLDFQHPVNRRIALGLNVYDDKTVLLSNTSAMLTFGYKVPLAENHTLGFGLSAGFLSNRLRLEDASNADINDPALLNATNNFNFDGQFGVHYKYKGLALGFSLTKLTDNDAFSENAFQEIKFNQLKNKIAFATYRFNVTDAIAFQPAFSYHFTSNDINFFDALGIVSYKGIVDVGGGYRQDFGPTALVRFAWKNLQFGYAFDFPTTKINVSTSGTNEIQLKWRFGKRVVDNIAQNEQPKGSVQPVAAAPTVRQQEPIQTQETQPQVVAVSPPSINNNEPLKATEPAHQNEQDQQEIQTPSQEESAGSGSYYLLVVGTFEKRHNAEKLANTLEREGLQAEVKYYEASGYYYVHLPEYKTKTITLETILNLRKMTQFGDAWFKQFD